MNYRNYLQNALGNSVVVTDEINYNGDENAVIVKYLQGSNYKESTIQPIQLSVYTNDLPAIKTLLDAFTKTYSNVPFAEDLEYIQQIYSTPMVLNTFQQMGKNYSHMIIVSGTLIVSSNISDIVSVKVDGFTYETTTRSIVYMTKIDNQRKSGSTINTTNVLNASIKFSCTVVNKNTTLNMKLRRIRTGLLEPDTAFTILLTFSDGATETYTMRLDSLSINSENPSLPTLSLSFIQ